MKELKIVETVLSSEDISYSLYTIKGVAVIKVFELLANIIKFSMYIYYSSPIRLKLLCLNQS